MKSLDGIRILDLTHMLSGPYATMILGDLGAELIKIEPPGTGEGTRKLLANDSKNSRDGMGAYFLTLNRNKKSVTCNLKSDAGRELFYELVRVADVVVDNFSAGVTERLKISHAFLSEINPRIITCTITGFGETGPQRDLPAFDMVAQAMGGGMSITGLPDSPPIRSGIPIGDLGGGLFGVVGILSALVAREKTGRGQHVDISMLDAQISMLNYMATMYFLSGEIPFAIGNSHFVHVPYDTFATGDGYIILAIITDNFWKELVQLLELHDLDTPENERQPGRWKNRAEINVRVAEKLKTDSSANWLEKLRNARIPCAPVNNFAQALNEPQIRARKMVVEVPLANGAVVSQPGNPVKLSDSDDEGFSAPPRLGEHTEMVLKQLLKKSDVELAQLRAQSVI